MTENSSTYPEALEILLERFPALSFQIPSLPPSPIKKSALPSFSLQKVEVFYVFGLEDGAIYFECKKWLEETPGRRLVFIEEDPDKISSFLFLSGALEILKNPQVFLFLEPEMQMLAEQFPVQRIETALLSSYPKQKYRKNRLLLFRKTTLSHALHTDRLHGYQPFQNFVQNVRQLANSFYAGALKGAFEGIPAVICGAGPSLERSLDVLKTLEEKALLIAGGSTLAALSSHGIMPHFGMAVDPNLEEYRRMKNSFVFEAPLLYSTRVFPSIFQTCNGPFGYMRTGIGGAAELWMEEELGLLDPLIGDFLSPESISVTTICVAWAQFIGCNPILLNGIDLAYTDNKRYASGVMAAEEISSSSVADRIVKRKDRQGKEVLTAVRWLMESAAISHFAKKHKKIRFINTTEGGIGFRSIPFEPLSMAAESFFKQPFSLRELVHEKINQAAMPAHVKETIHTKMGELAQSLKRTISFLRILAGLEKGSKALAELELKEELAYQILFFDVDELFKEEKWRQFLELSLKYEAVIHFL